MCCTDQYPVFAGSDMSINLLSANHGNAWNVLMPGILVVGGVAWRGVGQGGGALEVKTRFSLCSLSLTSGLHKRRSRLACGLSVIYLACATAQTVACVKLV